MATSHGPADRPPAPPMRARRCLAAAAASLLIALLALAPLPAQTTSSVTFNGSSGSSTAVSVTPSSIAFTGDVANPGPSWTFVTSVPMSGGSNNWVGWLYTSGGVPACVQITVSAAYSGTTLSVSDSMSPAFSLPINLIGSSTDPLHSLGPSCPSAVPAASAYNTSLNNSIQATLGSIPVGTTTANYFLFIPAEKVPQSSTVTLTFTAQ
jgi:hypothetical protein